MKIARRSFLGLLAMASSVSLHPERASSQIVEPGLKQYAARRGLKFGSALSVKALTTIPGLEDVIARECEIVVPENEMKWGVNEASRGVLDYSGAEQIAELAAKRNLLLRGHTAIWYHNIPAWTNEILTTPSGRDLIIKRVHDVVGHFRGRVFEWDVVNEAIDHNSRLKNGMREFPAYAPGDFAYIADSFHAAKDADPRAALFYNDFGLEYNSSGEDVRRRTALKLIEALQKLNAPIDGFGIQCHLKVGNNFNPRRFRNFLHDVASTGLQISLTEFDVDDQRLPADFETRDRLVADHALRFLEVALDETAVTKLVTWGLVNRSSWLNSLRPRKDGLPNRSLPLDDELQRTKLWHAIVRAFNGAPDRR